VFDLNGGDAAFTLVDDALWDQIVEFWSKEKENQDLYRDAEIIGWLCSVDNEEHEPDYKPEVHRPDGAPDPAGKVIKTWYTQTYCLEPVEMKDVRGILTFPAT